MISNKNGSEYKVILGNPEEVALVQRCWDGAFFVIRNYSTETEEWDSSTYCGVGEASLIQATYIYTEKARTKVRLEHTLAFIMNKISKGTLFKALSLYQTPSIFYDNENIENFADELDSDVDRHIDLSLSLQNIY